MARASTEDALQIDIAKMVRSGAFVRGAVTQSSITWPNAYGAGQAAAVTLIADLREPSDSLGERRDGALGNALRLAERQDRLELPPFAAMERIGRIAILAAQRAAGQAHEYGRYAGSIGLTLQRVKDLRELEPHAC